MNPHFNDCNRVMLLDDSTRTPVFLAFLRLKLNRRYSGAAMTGRTMQKQPNPQRQLTW
jgi:hypothetical protein